MAESEEKKDVTQELMSLIASAWFYGSWKVETPNERRMQQILTAAGWWPIESEDRLIAMIDAYRDTLPQSRGGAEEVLTVPAMVGNTSFGVGVKARLVVERAQREYTYQMTPEMTAKRQEKITQFLADIHHPSDAVTVPREVITLIRLVDEYCNALDNEAMDVGGYRPSEQIIGEVGPAVDDCMHLLDAALNGGKG